MSLQQPKLLNVTISLRLLVYKLEDSVGYSIRKQARLKLGIHLSKLAGLGTGLLPSRT